jgi:predicted TIM-barrel fold metal-dependent hydrolase
VFFSASKRLIEWDAKQKELSDEAKEKILYKNAKELFSL